MMYSELTLAEAKRDFTRGMLTSYSIVRAMGSISVSLNVETSSFRAVATLVDARTKSIRHFKTIDAAVSALQQIGFQVPVLEGRA